MEKFNYLHKIVKSTESVGKSIEHVVEDLMEIKANDDGFEIRIYKDNITQVIEVLGNYYENYEFDVDGTYEFLNDRNEVSPSFEGVLIDILQLILKDKIDKDKKINEIYIDKDIKDDIIIEVILEDIENEL